MDAYVTAWISGLTITSGSAVNGGGVQVNEGGSLTMTDCTVSGNSAAAYGHGGGVYNGRLGTLRMTGCTVSNNSGAGYGGGLANSGGTLSLTYCTLSGNSTASEQGQPFGLGGGLDNNGTATLTDSTVSGNSAYIRGGGIDNGGSLSLTNCTVSGNSALVGGGLEIPGILTMTNTIVAGNDGRDVDGPVAPSSANNLVGDGSFMTNIINGSQGNQVGTRAVPIDPLLAPLGDYGGPTETLAPLAGQPGDRQGNGRGRRPDHRPARVRPGRLRRHRHLPEPGGGVAGRQRRDRRHGLRPRPARPSPGDQPGRYLPGASTVSFSPTIFATPQTITLDGTALELKSGSETIRGPGSNLLSISGNNASRVFLVDANVTASISGLTITDGKVPSGAAAVDWTTRAAHWR